MLHLPFLLQSPLLCCDTLHVWHKPVGELYQNLLDHALNADSSQEKAIPGLAAVSALFAYHTAILFSHDRLDGG